MFDFGKANAAQIEAIRTVDGPVLIIAGPGTGKTFTLVQRAVYLIEEKHIRPEQILIATFTDKAAREIITRITDALCQRNIPVNINEMYIGTFHQICLRLIKEHIEYTHVSKNYQTVDDFEQKYLITQNMPRFKKLRDFTLVIPNRDNDGNNIKAWDKAAMICKLVNNLSEEMVDQQALLSSREPYYAALGRVWVEYQKLAEEKQILDFSSSLTAAYRLISENPKVRSAIREKIKYLMIDEYQDTNYIQEKLVFELAGPDQNICVVGDDDQGLYRFRGATIRNILEFPQKFPKDKCHCVKLTENYRSNKEIVDFCNNWMEATSGECFSFDWGKYRASKKITAHNTQKLTSAAVIKVAAKYDPEAWKRSVLDFIRKLTQSGKITDMNQIAFLFFSLKNKNVTELARYLEENGIGVYSPRASAFFQRREVKLLMGAMLQAFPQYTAKLRTRDFQFLDHDSYVLFDYYDSCLQEIGVLLNDPAYRPLRDFLDACRKKHTALSKDAGYGYTGLLYRLLAFEPFAGILNTGMDMGVLNLRPARNLSKLTELFSRYEHLENMPVLKKDKYLQKTEYLFNYYFKVLYKGGIDEYEDEAEYAPSGCVSFLTIHGAKGMEFPVVVVGSLWSAPMGSRDDQMEAITAKFCGRPPFEPPQGKPYFDFWRLYYTAFSRAQDLLILTANETGKVPSRCFKKLYQQLPDYTSPAFDVNAFTFQPVKQVSIKQMLSFTSHISVYEDCPLRYKFFKELGFTPVRLSNTLFGQVVHQTIEDIHKAALRGETDLITNTNIRRWLWANYMTLSKIEHAYLGNAQIEGAIRQVSRYVARQRGDWSRIQEAEVEVSLLKPEYILKGQIDLIRGKGDTVELVDFKSDQKPNLSEKNERLEHYKKQLQVYAHLVEERTGHKVSMLHLYYTADESSTPHVTFPVVKSDVEATIEEFDSIAKKILKKDFSAQAKNKITCSTCDFRFYCQK